MDKFAIFDQILDAVFVVKSTTEIVYANQMASDFCGLSQKRLIGKKSLADLFAFDSFPFPFNEESLGYGSPSPYLETVMSSLTDRGKSGRVQMAVSPWQNEDNERLWVFVLHDVSLEEALHSKYRAELEAKEGYIKELEVARAELEKYSKNLEEIVAQRTQELRLANRTLQAVINSLGQGFFTFDNKGICGDFYTRVCEDLLQVQPAGKKIHEVLRVSEDGAKEFEMWTGSLFSEPLPFEDLKPLGPNWFEGNSRKSVFLEYFPIRDDGGSISDVVVVATDKTQEVEAQKKLESEKSFVDMILKFVRGQGSFVRFLRSVPESFERIDELLEDVDKNENELFRLLHTLEGESGTFSLQKMRMSSRVPQQILQGKEGEWRNQLQKTIEDLKESYRESVKMVEDLFGPVVHSKSETLELSFEELDSIADRCRRLPHGQSLAEEIRSLKHQQKVLSAFSHYDGLLQNIAEKLGKRIAPIHFVGGDIKLDLRPLQGLISSFVHLFRNVVDHGIEDSEERSFIGKSPEGHVEIRFEVHDSQLRITVSDDGRGIRPSLIRQRLSEKFPEEDFSQASDEEVIQQILRPGFSSRDEVGEFSGRGVGMDAVREEVAKLGGEMRILSQEGKGTRFEFEIPLVHQSKRDLPRSA